MSRRTINLINMYCKNCGNELNENAIACLKCGCDPKKGNKNCHSCGVETNQEQVICIKCGVSLKKPTNFAADFLKKDFTDVIPATQLLNISKLNYITLGAAGLAAISVFLPWVEFSASGSYGGYSQNYSSGGISGISIGGGILGLLIALTGGFMALKNIKFAFIAGALNFLNGIGYMFGWFSAGGGAQYNSSFGGGSARASVDPQIGLYLFTLASLVFAIFTYKNLKEEKTE